MSKRFAMQYGYGLGLFIILVASKYVFSADRSSPFTRAVKIAAKYCLAVYIFHLPTMFFLTAVVGIDRTSTVDDIALLVGTLVISIGLGYVSFNYRKPVFDCVGRRVMNGNDR